MNRKMQINVPVFTYSGAGPVLVSQSIVPPPWWNLIQGLNVHSFQPAKKEPLEFAGVMLLHIHIEDLKAPVYFGAVHYFAVDILPGTSSINRYVRDILPFLS